MNDIKYTNGVVYNTYEDAESARPKTNDGDKYRLSSSKHHQNAQDSFDHCDTDGFVSQYCSGLNGQLDHWKALLADRGGMVVVPVIIDLATDQIIGVRTVDGKFGTSIPCQKDGKTLWIKPYAKRESTYTNKGVRQAFMHCYAFCKFSGGGGYGFSGLGSVGVSTIPFYNWLEVQVGLRQATQVA
jgi:hypothetical protein